jgi:type III secretion protein Q
MRALTQGDVVFISKRFIDEQQHLKLRSPAFGGRCWSVSARYEAHQLLLTESPTIMSDTADNPETAAGTADTANTAHPDTINSLQQLPIRLSFDVGQKTLSWHQMTQLQSGDTVSLDSPTSQYVTIRANGAVIGRGHLVEIDNRLGVAVDAIVHPGSAPSNEAAA